MSTAVRAATAADYPAFRSLFHELDPGDPAPSFSRWTTELMAQTLVADDGARVQGYVCFSRLGRLGHVRNLVVTRDARNRGVGHALMAASAAALRAAGVAEWHLNVTLDNEPAIHLYEKLGLRAEHRSTVVHFRWADVAKLPVELATVLPVMTEEDEDIERAFQFPSGRIAMARRRRLLVQLRDIELHPVGFAAFDFDFPNIVPFRVVRPALAATLLAALRKHAHHDDVAIIVEDPASANDADVLGELLVGAGSEVRRRILHYSGPLG
jgi:GNAT superfamily N-acetyltransferase